MKLDIAMWAKNGEKVLPLSLKHIEEAIPQEIIGKKIFVDDSSIDSSVEIAKSYGWLVFNNELGGIWAGTNAALSHVETPLFISVEQDVVLSKDWWSVMSRHLDRPKAAVLQGIRISSHPVLASIDRYAVSKGKYQTSIDNNIYRTDIIKKAGGFPQSRYAIDGHLKSILEAMGYEWFVVPEVESIHLREGGLGQELKHQYVYGVEAPTFQDSAGKGFARELSKTLFSPVRGIQIAAKYHALAAIYYYPLMRIEFLSGYVRGMRNATKG
jgi:hypothetical protein